MNEQSLSLLQLARRVAALVQQPETQNVWVTAELSDVAVRGGHCYMELLQKDDRGVQVAKARGVIWASNFPAIDARFFAATGQRFASGLKVMLRVSASMHPVYGFSLQVSDINPDYTMGDLLRRRREILERLQKEGILNLNRELQWTTPVPQRIAIVSAPGAAGYGDFMNQLYNNPSRIRFVTQLFPAVMQGSTAPASIIAALDRVAAESHLWDCVVIIRGGGATSDLQAFEDYDLASNVAQFPLPVVIGIGHERDVTVLDYIANTRLKTPTAVAEWLVGLGENMLGTLQNLGQRILQISTERISGSKEQLAHAQGLLPVVSLGAIERATARLTRAASSLETLGARRLQPQLTRLGMLADTLAVSAAKAIERQRQLLDSKATLLEALSPTATLARGYSITRVDGHAVTDADSVPQGARVETTLARGTFISIKQ